MPRLYASRAQLCPVLRVGSMGASQKSYRLYSCARCAVQVRICSDCDRGNQYCAGDCAQIRRRESLCRAGLRYQLSYRGAMHHAARQCAWREREIQRVTHQSSVPSVDAGIVGTSLTAVEESDSELVTLPTLPQCPCMLLLFPCCCFCWRPLPVFARWGPLRGGP